ncbi:MAG TPA: hypothetical protein PKL48_03245 [Thermodesulfobacteriota bacterium]|nr:hypothetical protein [Thermodesulfobacteriota bacterium]
MMENQSLSWDEIVPIISNFTVWHGAPELAWFKKSWHGLVAAELANYSNDEERHWVFIRAIALGIMYDDYCQLEWDVYSDADSLILELYGQEVISPTRIGNMVERNFEVDETDDQQLFCSMILDLVAQVRLKVYDALVKEYGDPCTLYAGLFVSREEGNDQENLNEIIDEIIDESGFTAGREEAFGYVVSASMLAVDA